MKLDVISEEVFYHMQDSAEILREFKDKLFTYTGELICAVGSMDINIKHNRQVDTLPLIVTSGKGPHCSGGTG